MRYSLLDAEHVLRQIAIDRRHRANPPSHAGWDELGKMPSLRPSEKSDFLIAMSRGICYSALLVLDVFYCGWIDAKGGGVGEIADHEAGAGIYVSEEILPDGFSSWPQYEKVTGDLPDKEGRHTFVSRQTDQRCVQVSVAHVADFFSAMVGDVRRLLKQARFAVYDNLERRIGAEAKEE